MTLLEFLNRFVNWNRTRFKVCITRSNGMKYPIGPMTYEKLCDMPSPGVILDMRVVRIDDGEGYMRIYVEETK